MTILWNLYFEIYLWGGIQVSQGSVWNPCLYFSDGVAAAFEFCLVMMMMMLLCGWLFSSLSLVDTLVCLAGDQTKFWKSASAPRWHERKCRQIVGEWRWRLDTSCNDSKSVGLPSHVSLHSVSGRQTLRCRQITNIPDVYMMGLVVATNKELSLLSPLFPLPPSLFSFQPSLASPLSHFSPTDRSTAL